MQTMLGDTLRWRPDISRDLLLFCVCMTLNGFIFIGIPPIGNIGARGRTLDVRSPRRKKASLTVTNFLMFDSFCWIHHCGATHKYETVALKLYWACEHLSVMEYAISQKI